MPLSKIDKKQQLKTHTKCYVCDGLNLKNATFKGYQENEIQFDHYRAKSLVGDNQKDLVANQFPIHAAKNGDNFRSSKYDKSAKRNCHQGKGNKFTGDEWVEYIRVYRESLRVEYSDDLFKTRKANDENFLVEIDWDEENKFAKFGDTKYPLMEQDMGNEESWVSFSTVVSPQLLWVDQDVQSRPADKKRMAELAWHLRTKPLLTPILCRYADKKLKVFDGNHRLCAFILARENHLVPVTIFKGPKPAKFLEVVAEAHDKLTQKKYQYSDKALKYSGVSELELTEAINNFGQDASEVHAWTGLTKAEVKLRLIGRVSQSFEDLKYQWRHEWKKRGLSDPSFTWMIEYYSNTMANSVPLSSEKNLREEEIGNLITLFKIFDEELFKKLDKYPNAKNSLKTKWWKSSHKRFRTQLSQSVRDSLRLQNTPDKPAFAPNWEKYIETKIRKAVCQWRISPVWDGDTTANNEPEVDAVLTNAGFTESYLFK